MILAALIIVATLAAVVVIGAGFVLARFANHIETVDSFHRAEKERLLTILLAPDQAISLKKLEIQAEQVAKRNMPKDFERIAAAFEAEERRYEDIGGAR